MVRESSAVSEAETCFFFLCQTNCPLGTLVSLRNQGVDQDTFSWNASRNERDRYGRMIRRN